MWPATENISVLTISAMYIAGVMWISDAGISVGDFVAFSSYISHFWAPITNLGNFYNQIIVAAAYLERIFETLDEPVAIQNADDAFTLPPIRGEVEFDHVVFSYEKNIPVLKESASAFKPEKPSHWLAPPDRVRRLSSICSAGSMISVRVKSLWMVTTSQR